MPDPMMPLMLNMCMVPGVKNTGGVWNKERTAFTITVEGGHPEGVAKMIAQCVSPEVELEGKVEVNVAGRVIRFNHEHPDTSQPSSAKKALPVTDDEGTAHPSGIPHERLEGRPVNRREISPWLLMFVAGILVALGFAWVIFR